MFKGNITRLILALIAVGACMAALVLLFHATLLDPRQVENCSNGWSDRSDDNISLAECLEVVVSNAQDAFDKENGYDAPSFSLEPIFSCDGNGPTVSFTFNPPVFGEFTLYWTDNEVSNSQEFAALDDDAKIITFNLGNAAEMNLITNIELYKDGELIYSNYWLQQEMTCSPDAGNEIEIPNTDGVPVILNSTCVGSGAFKQLMIVFEFEEDVLDEYAAIVADVPYELAPVTQYPNRLYYFGPPPPEGPIPIQLVSLSNSALVYNDSYVPVVCGPQEKRDNDDGGYSPPAY